MFNRSRAWCFALLLSFVFTLASIQTLFAHSPFDCSSRAIIHTDFVEVSVTTGSTLGEKFLNGTGVTVQQLPNGRPFLLNPALATNFFSVSANSNELIAREADLITDGLEFQFHFEFTLSPAKALELSPKFLHLLNSPKALPLVLTDETGNILGSAIVSEEQRSTTFQIPDRIFSGALSNSTPTVSALTTNLVEKPRSSTPPANPSPSFFAFLHLGIEHILTGFDHLLFLLALLLGSKRLKTMLWVITGFTLAHSLTLALAALNVISLSPRFVEPVIAISIVFVAAENFRQQEKSWQRYALTCGFGLIHGFGFADALRSTGLATGAGLIKPLLAFNLGVETGQIAVAAVALPILFLLQKQPKFQRYGVRVISGIIMLIAAWWFVMRIISSGE